MPSKLELYAMATEMRWNPTPAEKIFAQRLTEHGVEFVQQEVIGYYIVDFLIDKIIIEIDGYYHFTAEGLEHDRKRTKYLKGKGYTVRRIVNSKAATANIDFYLKPPPPKKTKILPEGETYKKKKKRKLTKRERTLKKQSKRDQELQKRIDKINNRPHTKKDVEQYRKKQLAEKLSKLNKRRSKPKK